MSHVKKMNGKPLIYRSFGDFNDPRRREPIGQHTSVEAATDMLKRHSRHGISSYGWVWIENFGVNQVDLIEVILKPHRAWETARDRALSEFFHSGLTMHDPTVQTAACCDTLIVRHLKTVRHFRYAVLERKDRALELWPWLRDVIATEILSGVVE